MSGKPVRLRALADRDVREAVSYYRREAGSPTAAGFRDALAGAVWRILENPDIGSRRIGDYLDIGGIRVWPLSKFPYLVVYRETETVILVYRVLHQKRDLPSELSDG